MSFDQRVAALERASGMTRDWGEREWSWYHDLSCPSVTVIVDEFARIKACRRWLHAHGKVDFIPGPHGGSTSNRETGWFWWTGEEERDALARRELTDLEGLLAIHDMHPALRYWLAEGDDAGWPPYATPANPSGYDAFLSRLARERARMAVHRGFDSEIATRWRADHPAWSVELSPQAYDAWELARLRASYDQFVAEDSPQ